MVAGASDVALHALKIASSENLMTGEVTLEEERMELPQLSEPIKALRIDPRHMWMFAVSGRARVDVFDLRRQQLNGRHKLLGGPGELTTVASLLGGISLLVGDSSGGTGQWLMVRGEVCPAELNNVTNLKLTQ